MADKLWSISLQLHSNIYLDYLFGDNGMSWITKPTILPRSLRNRERIDRVMFNAFYSPVYTGIMDSSSFIVRIILH